MKTMLTGGTGLVGANLAHQLCGQEERPRLLVRERSDRRGLRGLSYDEVLGDVLDTESLRRAMKGVERVYHVAGIVRFDPFTREDVSRINAQGTRNVLDAARAAGVRRVVVVSSMAAVGHGTLAEPARVQAGGRAPGTGGLGAGAGHHGERPTRGALHPGWREPDLPGVPGPLCGKKWGCPRRQCPHRTRWWRQWDGKECSRGGNR